MIISNPPFNLSIFITQLQKRQFESDLTQIARSIDRAIQKEGEITICIFNV